MSEDSSVKEIVLDEALEQVELENLLDDGSIGDDVDATALGGAVGRRVGERLGRTAGERVGAELHETVTEALEEDRSFKELLAAIVRSVRDSIATGLEKLGRDEMAASVALDEAGELEEEERAVEEDESEPEADEDETEETEESEDAAEPEDGEDSEETAAEDTTDAQPDDDTSPAVEDLEDLRRDAIEDVLEMCSYRELQSIAKDVDVKANLEASEMRERIIDAVADEERERHDGDEGETDENSANHGDQEAATAE